MVKCPRCGREAEDAHKEWEYSAFHIKLYNCPRCGKKFNAYYRDNEFHYTIPKSR
jgi:DNA-directed RNA polymerase subunit RPC12/RpoP